MVQPGEQWWPVTVRLGLLARFLKSMVGSDFRQRMGGFSSCQILLKNMFQPDLGAGKIWQDSGHTSNSRRFQLAQIW